MMSLNVFDSTRLVITLKPAETTMSNIVRVKPSCLCPAIPDGFSRVASRYSAIRRAAPIESRDAIESATDVKFDFLSKEITQERRTRDCDALRSLIHAMPINTSLNQEANRRLSEWKYVIT